MMRLGITGADGLLGRHLRARVYGDPTIQAVLATRETFANPERLAAFAANVDAIVHLAGMNRGDDEDIEGVNIALGQQLTSALDAAGQRIPLAYSSSTHIARDTAYGRSKRAVGEHLRAWGERVGAPVSELVLPGVFGEGGKPFYNSVVSTFCFQLAHGQVPQVTADAEIEQVHAQAAAQQLLAAVQASQGVRFERVHGTTLQVSELLRQLQELDSMYRQGLLPSLAHPFARDLFNTYRSYLFPHFYPRQVQVFQDNRGALFETFKVGSGGQSFYSTTHPGITRGNHYHLHRMERFFVVEGEAVIALRPLLGSEVTEFRVSGQTPAYVDIPTLWVHSITNVGAQPLRTVFWSDQIFDPANVDQFPADVVGGRPGMQEVLA
ncbi:NAD-dependent epimerase/dehydratase family protein [Deinococcus multiflagellatus]|uniref:NAD-dependent epimerase/dehydratase family protein n=1 Tax=Deinococcus multiflagellatus TaxID=1656887 RepID=A0ABW1ZMP3_9DEIO|nr:NAD-dependent epimerase/dehydratase family protein [Deinococcus multiflagellatus]MBZ9714125.1 NAD-dependent epimerase/dehydratase family protein [Deinococcus multiflagellatus]